MTTLDDAKGWTWVNQKHTRDSFYKYMPLDTALKVLETTRLRWSSPLLFNDPFDVPREITFGLEPQQVFDSLKRLFISIIKKPSLEMYSLRPELKSLLDIAMVISNEQKKQLIDDLENKVGLLQTVQASLENLREIWRGLLPELRILCLTESPEHAAMWYHYSDKYSGAVFEFRCIKELDSPWLIAKPVRYPEQKPSIYTVEGWTNLVVSDPDTATSLLLDEAIHTKAKDWSYENEWRIATFKRENDMGLFTDYEFNPNELAAIYLGPSVSNNNLHQISLLASAYPNVKLIQVNIGVNREFLFTDL